MEQKTQGEMAELCRRFHSNGGTSAKATSFLGKGRYNAGLMYSEHNVGVDQRKNEPQER